MPTRCDRACEILADKSARFVQFRKVLFAMKDNADANGWASGISLCARLAPRAKECCRMQDTTTYLRGLRSVACSCPTKDCPQNRARGRKRLRSVKSTWIGSHWGAAAPPSTDGGRLARRTSWFASQVKGGQCPRGPTTLGRPTA